MVGKKKKRIGEIEEEIDILGQDSEDRAIKWVKEKHRENKDKEKKEEDDSLNKLDLKKRSPRYSEILVQEANSYMKAFDLPSKYQCGALKTSKGIVFWYKTPDNKTYATGSTISLVPEIDMNAVVRKTHLMLDEIDKIEYKKRENKKNTKKEPSIIKSSK